MRGETYLNPRLGARLAAQPPAPSGPPDGLSERELDVLRLIALGHTNVEIGEQLYLSTRTVETHRAHIQQKTRAASRAELVRYAIDHGLIKHLTQTPRVIRKHTLASTDGARTPLRRVPDPQPCGCVHEPALAAATAPASAAPRQRRGRLAEALTGHARRG